MKNILFLFISLLLPSAWSAPLDIKEKYTSDQKAGFYGSGKIGNAIGLPGEGPTYQLFWGCDNADKGSIAFWAKPLRPGGPVFTGKNGLVSLASDKDTIAIYPYDNYGTAPRVLVFKSTREVFTSIPWGEDCAGKWMHIATTWGNGKIAIFINGKRIFEKASVLQLDSAPTMITNGDCLWLDELIVLSRTLSDTEVLNLANAEKPWDIDPSTVLYAPLDDSVAGQSALQVQSAGTVGFTEYLGVPAAMYPDDSPQKIEFTIFNSTGTNKVLVFSGKINDLDKKTVLEKNCSVDIAAGESRKIDFDLSGLKAKGLYWGSFSLSENDRIIQTKKIPFAMTLSRKNLKAKAVTGLVVSYGFNTPDFDKWDRITSESKWGVLEFSPDKWDFSRLDMIVGNFNASGRQPVLALACPPSWRLKDKSAKFYFNSEDIAGWKEYVRKTGERYRGKVFHYMFIGEAYHKTTVGAITTQEYVLMVNSAAEVLHAVDPSIKIACDMGGGEEWAQIVAKGTAGKADYYLLHPYEYTVGHPEKLGDEKSVLKTYTDIIKKAGAKPLFACTELSTYCLVGDAVDKDGYPMTGKQYDESGRWDSLPPKLKSRGRDILVDFFTGANRVVRGLTIIHASDFIYTLWWSCGGGTGAISNMMWQKNTPSPMSVAYANFYGLMTGTSFVKRIETESPFEKIYIFKNAGEYIAVIFTDKNDAMISLESKGKNIKIIDAMGGEIKNYDRTGDLLLVPVSPNQVFYITGMESEPQQSKPLLSVNYPGGKVFPGLETNMNVEVYNPLNGPLTGTLRLKLPVGYPALSEQPAELTGRSSKEFTFKYMPPITAVPGDKVEIVLSGNSEIKRVSAIREIPLKYCVFAERLTEPVKIDGNPEKWGNTEKFPIKLNSPEQVILGNPYTRSYVNVEGEILVDWAGTKDLSLFAKTAWDRDCLYVIARVFDDKLMNQTRRDKPNAFNINGDCIEIFLDVNPASKQGQPKPDYNTYHLLAVPPSEGFNASAFYVLSPQSTIVSTVMPLSGVMTGVRQFQDGWFFELAIPIRNFPALKKMLETDANPSIGLNIAVTDRDDQEKQKIKSQMIWIGSESPATWAQMIFKK